MAIFVVLTSVLFTQLAMAAYVCQSVAALQSTNAVSIAVVESGHHTMPGCEEMEMEQSALCHASVQVANHSLDKPGTPLVLSPAILLAPAIHQIKTHFPVTAYADATWLMRSSSPPLSIRNCCFRI